MKILQNIQSPRDVKELPEAALPALAEELRERIIAITLKNGGHLASNLGMVEATIALHRVFDAPRDTLLFDVSHQAYAHKLLTGRQKDFDTLRQDGGLSGFTKRGESPYDTVTAGHSGSALSTAIGMAEAKRLQGDDSWTVAIVGDGSFTNGMVYEALNQLADKNLRLILLLNDNEMSISKNVGGLSGYLAAIRTSEGYFHFKYNAKRILRHVPGIGDGLIRMARGIRDTLKRLTNSETWFESFGLEYIGPAKGNNIEQMIAVLEEAKKRSCPVVVHMRTKKGLGYGPAEEHPEKYHSIGGAKKAPQPPKEESPKPAGTFASLLGELLTAEAAEDRRICAITAAMTEGCGLADFAREYPQRFFDTGIAEEHAVTMAGGLALGGMSPVVALYSTFAQRVFDQMWHDVALQDQKAIFCFSHCGLVPGDGITHQGVYDTALFAPLLAQQPCARIYAPDDFAAFRRAFRQAVSVDRGISILRYPKGTEADYTGLGLTWEEKDAPFAPYKIARLGEGEKHICLLTYGRLGEALAKAARAVLEKRPDLRFTLVLLEQIAPLPLDEKLLDLLSGADGLLFAEEHVAAGGVGERLAAQLHSTPITLCAIEDARIPHGNLDTLMRHCGLDADSLAKRILELADK